MDGAAGEEEEPGVTAAQTQPKTEAAAGVVTSAPNGVQTLNGSAALTNCGASVDSVNNGPACAAAAPATSALRVDPQSNVTSSQQNVPTVTLVRPPVPAPSGSSPASPAVSSSSSSLPSKVDGAKPIIQTVASAATATVTSPTVLQNLRTPAPSTIAISTGGGVRPLGQHMMAPRITQPQQTTTNVQNIQLPPGNNALPLPHRLHEFQQKPVAIAQKGSSVLVQRKNGIPMSV